MCTQTSSSTKNPKITMSLKGCILYYILPSIIRTFFKNAYQEPFVLFGTTCIFYYSQKFKKKIPHCLDRN